MTFATDVTAIYAGRNGGKTYLSRKLVRAARLPRVVYIDPVAAEGLHTAAEVIAALEGGARVAVLRSADRSECLATVLAVYMHSTKARPVYLVCDEAPLYLDRATDALKKIMFQGRHRGLGMMILAQRPTAVAAANRSQAVATYWGRLTDHNDIALAAQAIGPARARSLSTAPTGHFIRHPE
jgi:DNA helicase HerA-like ATPase